MITRHPVPRKALLVGLLTLFSALAANIAADDAVEKLGARGAEDNGAAWSAAVGGLQGRLEMKHVEVVEGTPIVATSLLLRNVSPDRHDLRIPWRLEPLQFHLTNAANKEVETSCGGVVEGVITIPPDPVVIPFGETVSITLMGHGMISVPPDEVAMIDLSLGPCWKITKEEGPCQLSGVLDVAESKGKEPPVERWHGRLELPAVAVPLSVAQPDPSIVAARIEELGPKLLKGDGPARVAMSMIADERVIPWYVQALETHDYWLKLAALDRLSRVPGDTAFEAIQKGLQTQAADVQWDRPEHAAGVAQNVRSQAAVALARSRHPDAEPLLLKMWSELPHDTRVRVVYACGEMKTAESLALLKRMSDDSDPVVREHARQWVNGRETRAASAAAENEKK